MEVDNGDNNLEPPGQEENFFADEFQPNFDNADKYVFSINI
jgi:hypothetical protein